MTDDGGAYNWKAVIGEKLLGIRIGRGLGALIGLMLLILDYRRVAEKMTTKSDDFGIGQCWLAMI